MDEVGSTSAVAVPCPRTRAAGGEGAAGVWLAAGAILASAFLLFQVQPVIAKAILPWFGGSAAVWTTCMLFFQTVLLAGYLYAHWSARNLRPRWQALVHGVLLAVSLTWLPLRADLAWRPSGTEPPVLAVLGVLAASVGLPYFLLSATTPLVQSWWARAPGAALPYRLYALSNLASLAALVSYPVLVEPLVATRRQMDAWSAGYTLFCLLCGALAVRAAAWQAPLAAPTTGTQGSAIAGRQMLLWLLLAAVPSFLLLATTNHLCQNVAAIPFLWLLPLVAYLFSLIVCFDREEWYRPGVWRTLMAALLAAMGFAVLKQTPSTSLKLLIPLFTAGLFVACMVFHGELVRRKPHAGGLTAFYLMMSLGGALGGVLAGLLAPALLSGVFELPLGLAAASLVVLFLLYRRNLYADLVWGMLSASLLAAAIWQVRSYGADAQLTARNFFGALRVCDSTPGSGRPALRSLVHGTVNHGTQFLDADRRRLPTTYYGYGTGVQLALDSLTQSPRRVGLIGLGAGTLAAYSRPGDRFRFYEINPQVAEIARRQFTYLADHPAAEVVIGDGRLCLEREPESEFDLVAVDAFSGDSIPAHLLTREAVGLYLSRLKGDGLLALHISNSALDLEPVVESIVRSLGKPALVIHSRVRPDDGVYEAQWALVAHHAAALDRPALRSAGRELKAAAGLRPWTDDYSNLFSILK